MPDLVAASPLLGSNLGASLTPVPSPIGTPSRLWPSHPYVYVDNNPVNHIDPSGLHGMSSLCRTKLLQFAQADSNSRWLQRLNAPPLLRPVPATCQPETWVRYRWFLCWKWGHKEFEKFVSPDASVWGEPELVGTTFHPGAFACMRTKSANASGSGQ